MKKSKFSETQIVQILKEQEGGSRVERSPQWCRTTASNCFTFNQDGPCKTPIERFNGTYRREILDSYVFDTLDEVRQMSSEWIQSYNQERPHRSLNRMTPKRYLEPKPKNSILDWP